MLFDTGFNRHQLAPYPLEHNMEKLGIGINDFKTIVISHNHMDHVGGLKRQKAKTFAISPDQGDLGEKKGIYSCPNGISDILDFKADGKVDLVYSLPACDTATDKALYSGIRNNDAYILSVSCCQHSLRKSLRNSRYRGNTKHSVFKEKMVYMIGDSLRALLLELGG